MEYYNGLVDKWNALSAKIEKQQMVRKIVVEYDKYKNNDIYSYGFFLLVFMFFSLKVLMNVPTIESSIISFISSGGISVIGDFLLKMKSKRIKKEYKSQYPLLSDVDIDFDGFDLEQSCVLEHLMSNKLDKLSNEIKSYDFYNNCNSVDNDFNDLSRDNSRLEPHQYVKRRKML